MKFWRKKFLGKSRDSHFEDLPSTQFKISILHWRAPVSIHKVQAFFIFKAERRDENEMN